MSEATPMRFVPTLPPEEAARADYYALLARLFSGPPDSALLAALAGADENVSEESGLAAAWNALSRAAAVADPEAIREEYDTAFVGTGKAPVSLYTGAYTRRFTNEAPLAKLRGDLANLGLARRVQAYEPEDHIAALCDVMRHLIAQQQRELVEQRAFFEAWIWPAVQPLCDAIRTSEVTNFYKPVSGVLFELCTLEHRAFEML